MNRRTFLASIAGAVVAPRLRLPVPSGVSFFTTARNDCGPPLSVEALREALAMFTKMADERCEPLYLRGPLYLEIPGYLQISERGPQ